jgi:hypothetical protein
LKIQYAAGTPNGVREYVPSVKSGPYGLLRWCQVV